jgi:hypothetical protein
MAITVTHSKVSTIPDDADTDLVRPSDWNADHTLTGLGTLAEQNANTAAITGGTINGTTIGATTAVAGSFTDLSVTGTTSFDGSQGTAGQALTSAGSGNTPTWSDVVTPTGTQTLTNKTLTSPVLTTATTSGKFTFGGAIDETVFAVTGTTPALSPSNGTIQTWTLSGNSTPTAGTFDAGESMTLMIDDGTAYTVTWSSVPITWVGGTAPTLATTGYTVIELWKVGSTIYGALVGTVA